MKETIRKAAEIFLVFIIIIFSVLIFINREKIGNVSNVGYLGVLFLCFLANSTVLLPAPSLMIAASCALIMNPILVAFFAAVGSSLGEFVGYIFGSVSKDLSPKFKKILDKVLKKVKNPFFLVFILAVLPLPLFDVVGIYSGGTKMNPAKFFISCFLGKFIKLLFYTRIYDILMWTTTKL